MVSVLSPSARRNINSLHVQRIENKNGDAECEQRRFFGSRGKFLGIIVALFIRFMDGIGTTMEASDCWD